MNREDAYLSILEAAGKMQFNVSLILEAKSLEAEKARNWLCNHLSSAYFSNHELQLMQVIDIHQQIIAVIEGLTRLENGLGKNLKAVLGSSGNGENGGLDEGSGHYSMSGFS
ncbi:MAG: restriction endonuclease subunit S [Paenibacillaceae bacterium]